MEPNPPASGSPGVSDENRRTTAGSRPSVGGANSRPGSRVGSKTTSKKGTPRAGSSRRQSPRALPSPRSSRSPIVQRRLRLGRVGTLTARAVRQNWSKIVLAIALVVVLASRPFIMLSLHSAAGSIGPSSISLYHSLAHDLDTNKPPASLQNLSISAGDADEYDAPRLEIWSGGGLHYPLCRITHVHLTALSSSSSSEKDGKEPERIALLPSSLREVLRTQGSAKICGLKEKSFGFYNDDIDSRKQTEHGYDFIWPIYQPMEFHFPHFLSRFVERDYTLTSILVGDWEVMSDYNYSCFSSSASGKQKECSHRYASSMARMAPAHFLHSRLFENAPWVKEFLQSMDPEMKFFRPKIIPRENASLPVRSIITGRPQLPPKPLLTKHTLFHRNKISVAPSSSGKKDGCLSSKKTVLVLDRTSNHQRRFGYGRSFRSREELTSVITKEAELNLVNLSVKWEKFESKSFEQQAALMNEADVVLASHGAGNTNLVFMKKSALLYEVFPFGHVVSIFMDLADRLRVPYRFTIAKPEPDAFEGCLRLANLEHAKSEAEKEAVEKELGRVMKMFGKYAQEYAESDAGVYTMGGEMSKKVQEWNLFKMKTTATFVMSCLRHQELQVDPQLVAREIVSHIKTQCA